MKIKELEQAIKELRKSASDEQIIASFQMMYINGQLKYSELDGIINYMGYHMPDEFEAMDDETRKELLLSQFR